MFVRISTDIAGPEEFLIVTNGLADSSFDTISVFMIDEGGLFECTHTLGLPKVLQFATGGIMVDHQGKLNPVACGGKEKGSQEENLLCYSLATGVSGNSEVFAETVIGAASLVADGGDIFWITGGYFDRKTTIYIAESGNGSFSQVGAGPKIQTSNNWLQFHCMEQIGPKDSIVIGGKSGMEILARTWTFNIDTHSWNQGPTLLMERLKHSCGVLKDQSVIGKKIVIVAGGETSSGPQPSNSVENLVLEDGDSSISSTGEWTHGQALPIAVASAASSTTSDQSKLIVVGGIVDIDASQGSSSVFQTQCLDLQCDWSKLEVELRKVSAMGLAMMIPSSPLQSPDSNVKACAWLNQAKGKSIPILA